MAAQQAAPRPAQFVSRAIGLRVQVAECVQPGALGVGNLRRVFRGIEIAANYGRMHVGLFRHPGAEMG
jgi:hypothetical protein